MSSLGIPINAQAQAIKAACQQYGVPVQVFIGMYEQETALGTNVTNSSAGAIGPFQFEPGTAGQYGYPLSNSPSLSQFQAQANAAAHLLSDGFKQFHSWRDSLAAYNAGAGNIGAGMGYAGRALAFAIPGNWVAALNAAPGGPVKGGIAGAGGTGTTPNSATKSGFAIGSTDNPDEDIWTGVNRLAQEVQWYLFSDGETVYYTDGADLIAQDPGSNATVDRVKDSARIAAFEATLDNTAYQYQSHHKRKGKVQHKSQLSKIQSPTQVRLDLICGIDEFRAGDLIVLAGYGALNGRWLISDVTRSVFDVKSELTLVPPVAPLTEVEAAGTSGTSGAANSPSGGRGGGSAGALSGSARDKVVQVAKRAIARQASSRAYQYQEVRPYPRSLFGPAPIITDCSGFSILCYKDAGQSDPNGTNFDGSGFTGSLLGRGSTVSHPQPADLCFYYGGSHVAVYLGNGRIANMGSPGEPVEESISAPGGYPYTCRSYL